MIRKVSSAASSALSFTIVQPDSGTAPTADSTADTLTLTSANNLLVISGDSTTDTITFTPDTTPSFSTLAVTGDTTLTGDLAVNGGDLTTTAGTFNLINTTATILNLGGVATTVTIGANASGATTIRTASTTVANLTATGTLTVNNSSTLTGNVTMTGDLTINGGDLTSGAGTFNLLNSGITILNIGGAASTIGIGASGGTMTVANTTLAAQAITAATTLAVTGNTTLLGNLTVDDVGTFFVDSTQNFVGIGTLAPTLPGGSSGLQILADGSLAEFLFTSYRTASPRALIKMQGSRGTLSVPVAMVSGSEITRMDGEGYTASTFERATEISFQMGTGTVGSGSAPGRIVFSTSPDGTTATTEKLRIDSTNVVFNENSLDQDFRVESNGNANAIFVDGGNDRVGIMNGSPSYALDVTSDVSAELTGINLTRSVSDMAANSFQILNTSTHTITANNANGFYGIRSDTRVNQNGFNATHTTGLRCLDAIGRVTGATGTVTGAAGVFTQILVTNGGTLTNAYGVYIATNTQSGSTITNNYGLFMQEQTQGATDWAIYSEGGQSAHAGNLRIGSTTAPTVALDVTGAVTISGNVTVDTDVFFVDTTNNRCGFGTAAPSITSAADGFQIMADNNNIAEIRMTAYRTSGPRPLFKGQASLGTLASPTAFSVAGTSCLRIDGEYNTGAQFNRAAEIEMYSGTGTIGDNTSSPGRILFSTSPDGTIATTEKLRIDSTNVVFNENSLDQDFRIESDTNANCFFLDAGNSFIGVNNATPSAALDITGALEVSTTSTLTGQVTLGDANNVILGSTTGNSWGSATSQKTSVYGVTPIVQRVGAAQAAVATTAATNVGPFGYTTAAQADAIVTLVNELRAAMVAFGIIKGSA